MDEEEKNLVDYSVIKLKNEFYQKVEDILGDKDNIVGVHIRRTDHAFCVDTNKTEFFVKKIEEILKKEPSTRFFLSTDDKNEEDKLCALLGDKIIIQKDKKWGRDTTDGMESGIIDLLCLAKCKYILGCTSTFSFLHLNMEKKN